MQTKVSVLTPCYNGEKYIDRYFQSLLNQTYENFEILFIDDGSTDNTKKIVYDYIPKFKERNVVLNYVYQENGGQASAINNGLKLVTGEYLVWPDSDDYYESDALELLAKELDKDKSLSSVRGNVIYRKEENLSLIDISKPAEPEKTDLFIDYLLFSKNVCCFSGIIMLRMKDFIEANVDLNIYPSRAGQNWQILLPITYKRKCKYIDKNIYNCVVRKDSHSHVQNDIMGERKKQEAHKDILITTLNKIKMSSSEKKKYIQLVNKKYNKIILKLKLKNFKIIQFILKIKKGRKNGKSDK